jgi:DMSO/TMAO reductase YedYZ molybdopterin-dependent catalytic subunit
MQLVERNAPSTPEGQAGVLVVRLLVPVKLGLKNVKAITRITYAAEEPKDLWAKRDSYYDGI